MISWTQEQSLWGSLSNDPSSTSKALGAILCNEARRQILSEQNWKFLEKSKTAVTVASQAAYALPSDFAYLNQVKVTVSTITYTPKEIISREEWDRLTMTTVSSDIPQYFNVFNGSLSLYPVPATSSNTITYEYGRQQKDLSITDYTTGTITTIANGGTAVTGSGSTWTTKMNNRFIRITDSDTANTGDGFWYEVNPVLTSTTLTLGTAYNGLAISAGSAAYTIGQVSLLPEEFQMLPLYKALVIFFTSAKPDLDKSKLYNDMYVNMFSALQASEAGKSQSPVLNRGIYDRRPLNPSQFPSV